MTTFDRVALISIVALAALLRIPGIEARHGFDADQGHDMLVLLQLTRDGALPLVGPRTSVGEFHHGAAYYYLLAPAAAISGADPVAVMLFIALLGIAAVALTWWLAREIGGSIAGAIAGVLMAVSPAGIEQSTFIWNPNPIGFFAILSLAAAWRARQTGRAGWLAASIGAAGMVVQLHVLGVVFFVAMLAIAIWHIRHDRAAGQGVVAGLGLVVILFLPLLAHELQTGFLETRRVLDYLVAGDPASTPGPIATLLFTALRIVGWPIVGLVTDVPLAAAVLLALTLGLAVVGLRLARGEARVVLWWFVGILLFSMVALAFSAPSLQVVVAGLPNDHYHAFLDPIVIMLIAIPLAWLLERALVAWRSTRRPVAAAAVVAIAAAIAVIELTAVARKPPRDDPNSWPAMRDAGARIAALAAGGPVYLDGLPDFKLPDAIGFPIEHAGTPVLASDRVIVDGVFVVACDRLFAGAIEDALGGGCGGPAEDAWAMELATRSGASLGLQLIDRFNASPRTSISVYRGGAGVRLGRP